MNFAKYIYLVLAITVLAACGNGIQTDGSKNNGLTLDSLDSGFQSNDTTTDERPLIRARFDSVARATVDRRGTGPLPLATTNNLMACRIDDSTTNCIPPIYKEVVNVHIEGTGTASPSANEELRPSYYQSLSVDYELSIDGGRKCLDAAISALERNASFLIGGYGSVAVALPGTVGGSEGSGTTNGGVTTQETIANPPIWAGGLTFVNLDKITGCEVVARKLPPPPQPIDPPTPAPLPVEPQPANDRK